MNIYFGKLIVLKIPVLNNLYIIFVLYMNENLIEKELDILRDAVKNAEKNLKQKDPYFQLHVKQCIRCKLAQLKEIIDSITDAVVVP